MNRFLGLVTALLLAATLNASAQLLGCAQCYVISYIDAPADNATTVGPFYIAGWGFLCEGGAAIDRVEVWYQKDDGYFDYLPQPAGSLYAGLHRPDVQAAYQAHCPQVTSHSGFHLYMSNLPPAGTRVLALNVWRGSFYEQHRRTLTIVRP